MLVKKGELYFDKYRSIGSWFLVSIIVAFALILRLNGLRSESPFWVDEFSTGVSAVSIMKYGPAIYANPPVGFELNNSLTYLITTVFFQLFGVSETVARIPAIIMGSSVVFLGYLLGSKLANRTVGLISSLLIATSYLQITWSLQARGYMTQQFFGLVLIFLYISILRSGKLSAKNGLLAIAICTLGLLTHFMYVLVILSMTLNFVILKRRDLAVTKKWNYYPIFVSVIIFIWLFRDMILVQISNFGKINNVWYYHSFLWREYGMVTLMAILGYASMRRKAEGAVIVTHIFVQLIFVSFFFGHHMSKYLLPIFPYLLIGMAISIHNFGKLIFASNRAAVLAAFFICFLIVGQGHKFVIKPKQYYSINHDFREISNIDYDQVYNRVLYQIERNLSDQSVVMVETWMSRGEWYLRNKKSKLYYFRWENVPGIAGGQPKKTPVKIVGNEKYAHGAWPFIATKGDLVKLIEKNPKGFIFIDDDTLPRDVIDYAEKNLKKEIFLDHYPLDDNPYSKWPATLYSWGI